MDAGVTYEDGVLSFRAALSGGALVIREELVEYRVHEASTSSSGYVKGLESSRIIFDRRGDLKIARKRSWLRSKLTEGI